VSVWLSALKGHVAVFFAVFLSIALNNATASTATTTAMATNALNNHPSAYLAMHGQDPVHWQDWQPAVLQTAQAQNKLILISSGYFACHWCHVMQAETYQNLTSARLLNEHFISVKLDRELHPELDRYLIDFAKRTTGQAGWPLHVVLTPEGLPLNAFLYLPNADFNQRLDALSQLWRQDAAHLNRLARSAMAQLSENAPLNPQHLAAHLADFENAFLTQLSTQMDEFSGGLKGVSKFPKAPLLQALLHLDSLPKAIEAWLILTLEQMQQGHLFDHVNGGFYRYSIDPEWQTPHFEKMTYTNAQLANIYLQAASRWQREDFARTAQHTLDYLHTHLYHAKTGLYQSSQSAIDAQSQEGGNYLFNAQQLRALLTKDQFSAVDQAWSLTQPAPYALGWHPTPYAAYANDLSLSSALWNDIQARLQAAPQSQPAHIPRDDKSLLSWNGYVLSALSKASVFYPAPANAPYKQRAEALATRLIALSVQSDAPRAINTQGEPMQRAGLDDYAAILQGLEDWYAAHTTPTPLANAPLTQAIHQLKTHITKTFYTPLGWQDSVAKGLPGQGVNWLEADEQTPSARAQASCVQPDSLAAAVTALHHQSTGLLQYASYLSALSRCQERIAPALNP
jgi:hypothetical protein